MLTVIIIQKSSQDFVDRFRTLFEPFEESRQIAFCFWDEHGNSLRTCLPELESILRGVLKWNCIVAMPQKDEEATVSGNPFDYLCNQAKEPEIVESSIPLIRLAQIIGGIPMPVWHYEQRTVSDADGNHIVIEQQESNQELTEKMKKWNDLNDQYSVSFDRPSSLYLFKTREKVEGEIPTVDDQEILKRHESDSSMFWYRNAYPAHARFLIQDCTREGHAHHNEDIFRFWMTVLTLAINEYPTGTFEAYKVYQTNSVISFDGVHELFSKYYNRLNSIQYKASLQIRELQKNGSWNREVDQTPVYDIAIPVSFALENQENYRLKAKAIGLTGDCPLPEKPYYLHRVAKRQREIQKLYSSFQRTIDSSSIQCRYAGKLMDEELVDVDEYQYEEIRENLAELEKRIVSFRAQKHLPIRKHKDELNQVKDATVEEMQRRMTRLQTVLVFTLAMTIFAVGLLPHMISLISAGINVRIDAVLLLTVFGILVLETLIVLLVYRHGIRNLIRIFNEIITEVMHEFGNAGQVFTKYLSDCASFMRGNHLLHSVEMKSITSSQDIARLSNHVQHLQSQMELISKWLNELDRKVIEDRDSHLNEYFDFDIPAEHNSGYSIENDNSPKYIPSFGGNRCKAPYQFVSEFQVVREVLFEEEINVD